MVYGCFATLRFRTRRLRTFSLDSSLPGIFAPFQPKTFRYPVVFPVAHQFTVSLLELVVYNPFVYTILEKYALEITS